jgi:hypothetical protein
VKRVKVGTLDCEELLMELYKGSLDINTPVQGDEFATKKLPIRVAHAARMTLMNVQTVWLANKKILVSGNAPQKQQITSTESEGGAVPVTLEGVCVGGGGGGGRRRGRCTVLHGAAVGGRAGDARCRRRRTCRRCTVPP